MKSEGVHFTKPTRRKNAPSAASRHLYVSGLGAALGSTVEQITDVFSRFGPLDSSLPTGPVNLPADKRFCFSYVDICSAEAAYNALKEGKTEPGDEGIRVFADFAELYAPKPVGPPEPEDVALSSHVHIPGLRVVEDFVSEAEEGSLLAELDGDSRSWEQAISRRVQHFGFPFNYRTLMLDYNRPVQPIPEQCEPLMERMTAVLPAPEARTKTTETGSSSSPMPMPLTQMTVNEYWPGQGIAAHIDTFNCFGPDIYIVSLCSGITMTLTHRSTIETAGTVGVEEAEDTENAGGGRYAEKKHVWLPRRSLLVLTAESRYEWAHCISSRINDKVEGILIPRTRRVSMTFRQAFQPNDPPRALKPSEVETDHVFRVYDDIAVHWNHTRGKRKVHWHRVKTFLEALPAGSMLADVGSGDGKYFGLNPGVVCVGCDRSWGLLQVSKNPAYETFCCDVVTLPLTSDTFDATICVAVLHHLASKDRRVEAIRELMRITRPGGTILIQAWALEQEEGSRMAFNEQDVLVPWRLQRRFVEESKAVGHSISTVPGSNAGESQRQHEESKASHNTASLGKCEHVEEDDKGALVYKRYCHVYRRGEIEDICSYIPGAKVVETSWDKGNWVLVIEKVPLDRQNPLPLNPHKFACPEFVKRAEAAAVKVTNRVDDASLLTVVTPDNRSKKLAKDGAKAASS